MIPVMIRADDDDEDCKFLLSPRRRDLSCVDDAHKQSSTDEHEPLSSEHTPTSGPVGEFVGAGGGGTEQSYPKPSPINGRAPP